MNPTQLLAYFDRISEAPDAISRLRRFILDLAVRGKLVEQDPNDEPASELLKRIQTEKARLAKEGKGRKDKPNVPLLDDDCPFSIPIGWQWSQLATIGFISPRNHADGVLLASFVPMTLIPAEYGSSHSHEVRPWHEIKSGYTHFAKGDVGLAKITPCFENGKSTVFRGLTGGIGAGTTELHIVRPLLINADYVLLFLKCPRFIETAIPRMTGTAGQKRVSAEYFAYSPFPLPPVAEQHRIVAKVDELMVLCDRLAAAQAERESRRVRVVASSLHRLNNGADADAFREHARFHLHHLPRLTTRPEHIQQLRQAILSLAVRGKLVPQDLNDEPASKLIARIQSEKGRRTKTRRIMREAQLPPIEEENAPFELPSGWAWARFPELGVFGRGKSKHRPRNDPSLFEGGTHLLVQTGDVARSNGFIKTFTGKYNEAGLAQSEKWPKGTLCVTIAANIADSGILSFDACFPDSVVGFIPSLPFENARYFEYFVRTAKGRLLQFAPATAQKNINLGILNGVFIPLPPLAEQRRVVAKVDELMTLCDRLEAQLTTNQTENRRLLDAILHHALALAA
jgi:type I restriction enzyme S subunit